MASKITKVRVGVALTVFASLAIVLAAPSPVLPGETFVVNASGETALPAPDFSTLPEYMLTEAQALAEDLFGDSEQKQEDFVNDLLATYQVSEEKDVIVFFNSGGWGWDAIDETVEGRGFIDGIREELTSRGLSSVFLNYKRTTDTLNSGAGEFLLAAGLYPAKSENLAVRVGFLTEHLPNATVILAGISNGTLICDGVMESLGENGRIFSIQMGPPFWNDASSDEKNLVIRDNGDVADTFSQGNLFEIVSTNLEALFGQSQEHSGDILLYIGAPGHDYKWEQPVVRGLIIEFLNSIFSQN